MHFAEFCGYDENFWFRNVLSNISNNSSGCTEYIEVKVGHFGCSYAQNLLKKQGGQLIHLKTVIKHEMLIWSKMGSVMEGCW